jgi:hypothetical protein
MSGDTRIVMLGLELGTNKAPLTGTYQSDKVSFKLAEPVKTGTVNDILKAYDVDTAEWPDFLKQALDLEAEIRALSYESTKKDGKKAETYTLVVRAQYAVPLEVVKGLVYISFFALGMTNDPRFATGEDFEKFLSTASPLVPAVSTKELDSGSQPATPDSGAEPTPQ